MVELVVLACLMAEPQRCEEFHMPFLQPVAMECTGKPAVLEVIQWANDHPLWTIKKWTCGPPRT